MRLKTGINIFFSPILFLNQTGLACDCKGNDDVSEEVKRADAIFSGVILSRMKT